MKGAFFVLCSGVVLFLLFASTVHCADFSSITCNITISSNSSFQNYLSNEVNNGPWTGVRNVCFQEGLYTIPQTSSMIHISYAQTWYGPQFLSDPTCSGSFVPSCERINTARSLNSTFESVITFSPVGSLATYIFFSTAHFSVIGFAMSLNAATKSAFVFNSVGTLQYNYFNFNSQGDAIILDTPGCSAISNYIESTLTTSVTNGIGTQYSSIIKNNFLASSSAIVTYSGSSTIIGNIFSQNEAIYSTSGPNYISNNTFIYVSSGINLEILSTSTVIDNNVFVFSNTYGISLQTPGLFSITNNIFAGLFKSGAIAGTDTPNYLANNDFVCNSIDITAPTWNTNSTYVLDNYCGEDGVWQQPLGYFSGNTEITTFYAHVPSFFPYTLTPNHQGLPDGDILSNIMWTAVGKDRPYFVIGDQLNISLLYLLPDWFDKYDIPSSQYFPNIAASSVFYLFHGANDNSPLELGLFTLNYGKVNVFSHTLSKIDVGSYNPFVPHSLVFLIYGSYFHAEPRSVFSSDPVTFHLSSDLVASVYTDPHIQNITISITSQYHQTIVLDYLLYGNNLTNTYTLPLQNSTKGYNWKVSVNFTLPSGDTWLLENSNLNGLVLAKPPLECYNLSSIIVDKGVQKVSPIQSFTFQDLGCNTTEWEIVGVSSTALFDYYNNSIQLNISSEFSGTHAVHYQVADLTGSIVHNVKTRFTIVNHNPVINNSTFTWTYPRTTPTFPNWNLLSGCTDQDGDNLRVIQIQATAARVGSTFQQLDPLTLYFITERVVLHVAQTGEITLTTPSNSNPVTAGSPLSLFWNKDLSFQFQISDGDITNQYAWGIASVNSV